MGATSKNDRIILICFQGNSVNFIVIEVYTPTMDTEEAEVDHFYEDLEDLLELILKNIFHSSSGIGMQK